MAEPTSPGPLSDLTVIDACTLFAGPLVSTIFGDFGATVIKVEHPRGDALRTTGYLKDGKGLWWKVVSRNKKCVTLDLSHPAATEVFKRLVTQADVLLEAFRPGTLERWGLGWDVLHEVNPGLVMVRMSGFGQAGPYASRPGFGTLAEALSGFAHLVGQPDGPPSLPPFGLGDGVAALTGAWATMFALHDRSRNGGRGQMVDLALYEPLMFVVGPQITFVDQLGIVDQRTGNRTPLNAPRNLYRTADDRWVAIAATGPNVPRRIMELVGHPEVADEAWFTSARGRAEHADLLDSCIAPWIARHSRQDVIEACEAAGAAVAPVYDAADIASDPHIQYRSIASVPDDDFGEIKMQNILARLSATPGGIRWSGPGLGEHNEEVYLGQLGLTTAELNRLHADGVV
jgi:crotonobetainyl-CoA:carnitine CoA-transferase CaiB-like acyl-CoA transferase